MPVEYTELIDELEPFLTCPVCMRVREEKKPFRAFMRGQVQSRWRKLLRKPYCAVICSDCKEIVGYEQPWKVEPRWSGKAG
jgi:hypothetical protein